MEMSKMLTDVEMALQDFEDSEMTWKARYQDCSTSQASSSTPSSSYEQEQDRKVELSQCTHTLQELSPFVADNPMHCSDCLFEERRQRLNLCSPSEGERKFPCLENDVLRLRREAVNRTSEMFKLFRNPPQSASPSHADKFRTFYLESVTFEDLRNMRGKKTSRIRSREAKNREVNSAMGWFRKDFSSTLPSCTQPSSLSMLPSSCSTEEEESKKIEKDHVSALDGLPNMAEALPSTAEGELFDSLSKWLRKRPLKTLKSFNRDRKKNERAGLDVRRDPPSFMSSVRMIKNQQELDERRTIYRIKKNRERRQRNTEE